MAFSRFYMLVTTALLPFFKLYMPINQWPSTCYSVATITVSLSKFLRVYYHDFSVAFICSLLNILSPFPGITCALPHFHCTFLEFYMPIKCLLNVTYLSSCRDHKFIPKFLKAKHYISTPPSFIPITQLVLLWSQTKLAF